MTTQAQIAADCLTMKGAWSDLWGQIMTQFPNSNQGMDLKYYATMLRDQMEDAATDLASYMTAKEGSLVTQQDLIGVVTHSGGTGCPLRVKA